MRKTLTALVLGLAAVGNAYAGAPDKFSAHLQGFNAGGAAVATNATGEAKVEVLDSGTALKFRVNVAGIRNLFMAHIHIAPQAVNVTDPAGPVAFWFVGGGGSTSNLAETVNGQLAEGFIITDKQLVSWNSSDQLDATVGGLIKAIREGRASVIVHTDDLDPNTPTGVAGDSRAGELRGTLR